MDVLSFVGSFTATVLFNGTPPGHCSRDCPREHEGDLLALLGALLACLMIIALGFKLALEREAAIIEIASNPNADFLERISFIGEIPSDFVCPITRCIMQDPVRIRGGHINHVFERTAFEKWIYEEKNINPLSGEPLSWWTKLVSASDVSEKIKIWMSELQLRRRVFSMWSHRKISKEKSMLDIACLSASP